MSRSLYPRSYENVEAKAADVLNRYALRAGWPPGLPVPIEAIIETHFDLRILWEQIPEEPGEAILAMLVPAERRIVMNESHSEGILANIGPYNFSLAHELGHWLFDAAPPNQGELFAAVDPVYCRGARTAEEASRIREGNADRFAAAILMPSSLMPLVDLANMNDQQLRSTASDYGVSLQALRIRISKLRPAPTQEDKILP